MKYANKQKLDAKYIKKVRKDYIAKLNKLIEKISTNSVKNIYYLLTVLFFMKPKKYSFWIERKRNICFRLIRRSESLKKAICDTINSKVDETYFGNLNSNRFKGDYLPYTTIFGDMIFIGSSTVNCDKLINVYGDLNFSFSAIHKLNVEYIYGDARFFHANIAHLDKLHSVMGNLDIRNSNLSSLPELHVVGGTAYIYNTEVKELPKLKDCGNLVKSYSQLIDTDSFKL